MAVRDLLLYWVLLFVHVFYVEQLLKLTPLLTNFPDGHVANTASAA